MSPQLATLATQVPNGNNWLFEIKFDGYRTMARQEIRRNKQEVRLYSRGGLNWTARYPEIRDELLKFHTGNFYLDGEIVWLDENGISHFDGLQNAFQGGGSAHLKYFVFDLLYLDDRDLRAEPLAVRREILKTLIQQHGGDRILLSEDWQPGPAIYDAACKMKLEGVIAKKTGEPYESGRQANWLKIKCKNVQEFVVGGFTLRKGVSGIGALVVGAYDSQNHFRFLGRVGTGFSESDQKNLAHRLRKMKSNKSPFFEPPPMETGVQWVRPELVIQVEYGDWTDQKILRHSAFKGVREDKKPEEVLAEAPVVPVLLTNPEKVFYPSQKITKSEVSAYYEIVHRWMMPHVANRPLSLLRCPDGIDGECFFQKHVDISIHHVYNEHVFSKTSGEKERLIVIREPQGLSGLVQMGVLEIHSWGCHVKNLDYPDLIVFDLDPGADVSWKRVVESAQELKDLLERIGLKSFVKVTGGKGLHIHVPTKPQFPWVAVKEFSRTICQHLMTQNPEKYVITLSKTHRKNKIFLDYLRNGFGATAILPYSVRAKADAPIAAPVDWKELTSLESASEFQLRNFSTKWLSKRHRQKDPWDGYFDLHQSLDQIQTS